MLPSMPYPHGIGKTQYVSFKGYKHTLGSGNGDIYDMKNMTGDDYPVLSVRPKRSAVRTTTGCKAMLAYDDLYLIEDNSLKKYDTSGTVTVLGTVPDTANNMAYMNGYILIMPGKLYYKTGTAAVAGSLPSMESTYTGKVNFENGYYAGAQADKNTIEAIDPIVDFADYFKVGDAVKITDAGANNTEAIVREISGQYLRFYENTFAETGTDNNITIKREVPVLDFMFENENRLWGCKGDRIYASKLGDPFNFNVFDGLSTDSYQLDVGSSGDFTAAVSFLGYPIFFKEEHVYKVYGARPSDYQLIKSAVGGVEKGSGRSLAIAGEVLFYLSRSGICAYTGGVPENISSAFGDVNYKNAVAGSDGRKYYVSMQDDNSVWHMFVYDTMTGMWHKEDNTHATCFAFWGGLCFSTSEKIWRTDGGMGTAEADFESMAEFGDFTYQSPNRKGIDKVQIRIDGESGSSISVYISYDSGAYQLIKTVASSVKKSFYLPVIPRRCDHFRLKFTGTGEWQLYSLAIQSYIGSEL